MTTITANPIGDSALRLRLHEMTDEELDTLRFGVIELNRAGTILRYNLAESRFARLDRASVLGKDFFVDVAPCTATDGFQGHVERFMARGNDAQTFDFDYVFDFRFGAQLVHVELIRAPNPDVVYIAVNRQKSEDRRPEVPDEQLAAAQASLAPDESRFGVRRDTRENRRLEISPVFVASAAAALRSFEGVEPRAFFAAWGHAWGRRATVELQARTLDENGALLSALTMAKALDVVAAYLRREGWGRLTVDFEHSGLGVFFATLERNALAETSHGRSIGDPMIAGFLAAVFSHLAGRLVHAEALGDPGDRNADDRTPSVFVLGAQERAEELRQLAPGQRSANRVAKQLTARLDAQLERTGEMNARKGPPPLPGADRRTSSGAAS